MSMPLNPFGIGLTYWNNWLQEDDSEFIILAVDVNVRGGIFHWSMGAVGFGFVFCWKLPF